MLEQDAHSITSIDALEALYGTPGQASLVKVTDRVIPEYATLIEASPSPPSGLRGLTARRAATNPASCASMMSKR